MKDLLIAGNRFTEEDIERVHHIQSTIQTLKEEIDTRSYFAFYTVFSLEEDNVAVPKVVSRDEHLQAVYSHIISEFNKLSCFAPEVEDEEEDVDGESEC